MTESTTESPSGSRCGASSRSRRGRRRCGGFLVDPEKQLRWMGVGSRARPAARRRGSHRGDVPGNGRARRGRRDRPAAPARLHLGLGAGRRRADSCRPARRRSSSSSSPPGRGRSCASRTATCRPRSRWSGTPRLGALPAAARTVGGGGRPGPRSLARLVTGRTARKRRTFSQTKQRRGDTWGSTCTSTRAARHGRRPTRSGTPRWPPGGTGSAGSATRSSTSATRSAPRPR